MSKYQVTEQSGLIGSFILGRSSGFEPAPEGFEPSNRHEWIKKDGEWVRDPEAAEAKRKELEDE